MIILEAQQYHLEEEAMAVSREVLIALGVGFVFGLVIPISDFGDDETKNDLYWEEAEQVGDGAIFEVSGQQCVLYRESDYLYNSALEKGEQLGQQQLLGGHTIRTRECSHVLQTGHTVCVITCK